MSKIPIYAVLDLLLAGTWMNANPPNPAPSADRKGLAFVTYIGFPYQEAAAAMLVDSIRARGGEYRDCPVYVVLVDPEKVPGSRLKRRDVELVPLDLEGTIRRFPFAAKAYAAAKIEELVAGKIRTLAWFDPETLLLQPPRLMDLTVGIAAAVNPVHLVNGIGIAESAPLDGFWTPIVQRCGLDPQKLFPVESLVDAQIIRAYLNCGIFSVQPERGMLQEWARTLDVFLRDAEYQRTACPDTKHRTFLHQAVFTCILVSKLVRAEIRLLPAEYGYPLHLHWRMPLSKKARTLDELVSVFHESLWIGNQNRINDIPPASESLKKWLIEESRELPLSQY